MSVRHQTRAYVERLFEGLKNKAPQGEFSIYCVYSPLDQEDIEDFEFVATRVNLEDNESIKKFLDKTTRETLENQVKGLNLLCMVLDTGEEYLIASENPLSEELKEEIEEKIEKFKEE